MTDRHELYDRIATLTTAAAAREADREEARDALEAAGHPGAHIDDWPRITPAVHALIAERDALHSRLEAACALHTPIQRGPGVYCARCSGWDGRRFLGILTDHPCPTLRALDAPSQPNPDTTQETRR